MMSIRSSRCEERFLLMQVDCIYNDPERTAFPRCEQRHGEGRWVRLRGLVLETDGVGDQKMLNKGKDSPSERPERNTVLLAS